MPRKLYRQRKCGLSGYRKRWLLDGGPDLGFPEPGETDPDEGELRELWAVHGDELTAEHVEGHAGSRPWAWWRWNAPEPRGKQDELDYLRKHNLLDAAEKRAVAARIMKLGWTTRDFPWLKQFANA
jgi:hypothetical protein